MNTHKINHTGYVQVYTGNGKGKSTAAFGLALRSAGAKKKIFIAQFLKGCFYSEHRAFKTLRKYITYKKYGGKCFVKGEPTQKDRDIAQKGLIESKKRISSGKYDVVILDEANIAVFFKLFSADDLLEIISCKPKHVELIITGRYADPKIIQKADLVTEMKEIKHYFTQGVMSRKGIEE